MLGVGLIAGCAAPVAEPEPSVTARDWPAGLEASLIQQRSDVAARQAQVRVRNDTDDPIEIGAVSVSSPLFDGVAPRVIADRSTLLAPGSAVDIRIQLPDMDCDADEGDLRVAFTTGTGVLSGPLDDTLGVIGPLRERECLAERVADAAYLTFSSFRPSPDGEPAHLSLSISPTGRAAAVIGGVQTTNLLAFATGEAATTLPIGLVLDEGSTGMVVVDVPIVPLRCDPHAVQEDKRGTVFTIEVEIDGEPGQIELAASEDMRADILTWVADWCDFGE